MPQLRDSSSSALPDVHDHDFSRIFGIETEYGLSLTQTAQRFDPSQAAMVMFEPVVSRNRSTSTYLTNGARLYLDVGSHPEYATAEARTPTDAVLHDAAGEEIMRRLAQKAQERLAIQLAQPKARLHLYKNNLDAAGNSFGCHENYLLRRSVPLASVEKALIPFLATRLVWAGAGHVSAGESAHSGFGPERGFGYEISQRANVLDEAVSSATTRVRPMINTRDEPHANPDKFRRLHVIVGDSNRSQTATWLRMATTHLVLCMIEQSVRDAAGVDTESASSQPGGGSDGSAIRVSDNPFLALLEALPSACTDNPTGLMKAVSRGERDAIVTALSVQRLYCNAASGFVRRYHDDLVASGSMGEQELDESIRVWDEAVAAGEYAFVEEMNSTESDSGQAPLGSGVSGLEALANQMPDWVEWAAKLRLLEAYERRHAEAKLPAYEQIELTYHDITDAKVFEGLVQQGTMPHRVSQRRIEMAVHEPPTGTRAMVRGEFVRAASSSSAEWSCDWTHIEARNDSRRYEARLLDPFETQMDASVREVFDALRQ